MRLIVFVNLFYPFYCPQILPLWTIPHLGTWQSGIIVVDFVCNQGTIDQPQSALHRLHSNPLKQSSINNSWSYPSRPKLIITELRSNQICTSEISKKCFLVHSCQQPINNYKGTFSLLLTFYRRKNEHMHCLNRPGTWVGYAYNTYRTLRVRGHCRRALSRSAQTIHAFLVILDFFSKGWYSKILIFLNGK